MTGTITRLVPSEIGAAHCFDSDAVLEKMKGKTYDRLVIIGDFADGSRVIESNCNSVEALFLIERAKHDIIFGEDE